MTTRLPLQERYRDLIKVMQAHGFEIVTQTEDVVWFYRMGMRVCKFDDAFACLLDAMYKKGFNDGFERGAYEQMTQEDV